MAPSENMSTMGKRAFLSESDTAKILRRYSAVTVMWLLREIANFDNAKFDWKVLVKKSKTGISSAREYQALWRHIAYRADLADCYADDDELSDNESDLDFELLPSSAVSSDASADIIRWVQADMQRYNLKGHKKRKKLINSKSKAAGPPTSFNRARFSSGLSSKDGIHKADLVTFSIAPGDSSTASPSSTTPSRISGATPECTYPRVRTGQSGRKKRKLWSREEDQELISAVDKFGEGNWTNILKGSFTHERTAAQLAQRWALIRKRKEALAATDDPTFIDGIREGHALQLPTGNPSPQTSPAKDVGDSVNMLPDLHASTPAWNKAVNEGRSNRTAETSLSSGNHVQVHMCNSVDTSPGRTTAVDDAAKDSGRAGCNGHPNSKSVVASPVDPSIETGTKCRNGQDEAPCAANTVLCTVPTVTATAAPQGNVITSSTGISRTLAQRALVMSRTWQAPIVPMAGQPIAGKYVGRSNSGSAEARCSSSKSSLGPDPGVQAAAVAAGARIAPASTAASLLKAAHRGNVVHVGSKEVPVTKSSRQYPAGLGQTPSSGPRGSTSAKVRYFRTGPNMSSNS